MGSRMGTWAARFGAALLVMAPLGEAAEGGEHSLGDVLPLWTILPFVGVLLTIALMPLFLGHWWEKNRNKAWVAAGFSLPVIVYLVAVHGHEGREALVEKSQEYISFVILLGVALHDQRAASTCADRS